MSCKNKTITISVQTILYQAITIYKKTIIKLYYTKPISTWESFNKSWNIQAPLKYTTVAQGCVFTGRFCRTIQTTRIIARNVFFINILCIVNPVYKLDKNVTFSFFPKGNDDICKLWPCSNQAISKHQASRGHRLLNKSVQHLFLY